MSAVIHWKLAVVFVTVQQTQHHSRTMKASTVQQAFKSIASRIHPQLPLSERESQRLLSALTSSFRKQLDHDAHPQPAVSSTDNHLASILTSPLLAKPLQVQLKSKSKHPIALFEDQVAAGHATLSSARLCLDAFRTSLQPLSPADANQRIQHYAAGTRALRWLWSSASTPSLAFTLDTRFCNQLVFFLVREGKTNALWELIDAPIPHSATLSAKEGSRRKGLLLLSIVRTLLSAPQDALPSALAAFFRALETSHSSHASISMAGTYLTQALLKLSLSTASDVNLFDRFVRSVPQWNKNHPDRAVFKIAHLRLHHPTSPSADEALGFIRTLNTLDSHPFLNPTTASQKATVFSFFFDTVRLLQEKGRLDDSAWVMEFLQQRFPEFADSVEASSEHVRLSSPALSTDVDSDTHLPEWRVPGLG